MNAIEKSVALWEQRGYSEMQFWEDIQIWGKRGIYIHLRPDYCVCAEDLEGQAWFVYLAVGNMGDLLALLPYELPMIGWEREAKNRRGVKYYPMKKVLALYALGSKSGKTDVTGNT